MNQTHYSALVILEEGFKSDAQRKAVFAKGRKKLHKFLGTPRHNEAMGALGRINRKEQDLKKEKAKFDYINSRMMRNAIG
jgi:hypothetical protein